MEQIIGFEGRYEIHLTGDGNQPAVYSCLSKKYMTPRMSAKGYCLINLVREDGKVVSFRLNRLLGDHFLENDDPENKKIVDHINRDRSDNRLQNLRWVTQSENNFNTSRLVWGYHYDEKRNKYVARITKNKRKIHLGDYTDEEDAHDAYLKACDHYYPNIRQ